MLKIEADKIILLIILVGIVFLVGHAQSRFDICRRAGQKTIGCVLRFE